MLRGVFVGAGQFARVQLDAWQAVAGARIIGLVNRTLGKGQALAEQHGIPAVGTDLRAMLQTLQPDFVDLCTAVETHLPLARIAADCQVAVLCQKPPAPSLAETDELLDTCRSRNVRLMINDNWRWQAWYRQIKVLLDEGRVGQVFHAAVAMRPGDGWGPEPYARQPYFRDMRRFLLFETGIHYFDMLRFLFGDVASVACRTQRIHPAIAGEDLAVALLTFRSGATAVFDGNRVAAAAQERPPANGWLRIEGTDGNLRLDEQGRIFLTPRGASEQEFAYRMPPGYRGGSTVAAQQHFVDGLTSGAEFETSGTAYRQSVEIMFACYRSAAEQVVVSL